MLSFTINEMALYGSLPDVLFSLQFAQPVLILVSLLTLPVLGGEIFDELFNLYERLFVDLPSPVEPHALEW